MNHASNGVVALYHSHKEAEAAVKQLQHAGIDLSTLSIVGRDYHVDQEVIGYYNTGDRVRYWGKIGMFWGGLWGLLVGSAFFIIPGLGPIVMAGPLVTSLLGALEGSIGIGGLTVVGAALYSIGIPEDSVLTYDTAIRSGKYLLMMSGSAGEVACARQAIQATAPDTINEHQYSVPSSPTAAAVITSKF